MTSFPLSFVHARKYASLVSYKEMKTSRQLTIIKELILYLHIIRNILKFLNIGTLVHDFGVLCWHWRPLVFSSFVVHPITTLLLHGLLWQVLNQIETFCLLICHQLLTIYGVRLRSSLIMRRHWNLSHIYQYRVGIMLNYNDITSAAV